MADRAEDCPDTEVDADLIRRVLSEPDKTWGEFWSQHGPFVARVLRRFRLAEEDHEDVLQDIAQSLIQNDYKKLRDWDPERGPLRRYLTVVAVSGAINFVKSSRHRYTRFKADSIDPTSGTGELVGQLIDSSALSPFERLDRIRMTAFLKDSLDAWVEEERIRPEDREIVEYRLRGLTFREIAEQQGVPLTHVTTRFARLKPRLKKRLESAGLAEE